MRNILSAVCRLTIGKESDNFSFFWGGEGFCVYVQTFNNVQQFCFTQAEIDQHCERSIGRPALSISVDVFKNKSVLNSDPDWISPGSTASQVS